ncbi:MAG: hypothetical protein RBU37_01380 [Myxococcota bacterium]|jgi:hypothetical protein|nr:hypothetical protein [Myxococcota bacterium]
MSRPQGSSGPRGGSRSRFLPLTLWDAFRLRLVGDTSPFWQRVVGCRYDLVILLTGFIDHPQGRALVDAIPEGCRFVPCSKPSIPKLEAAFEQQLGEARSAA